MNMEKKLADALRLAYEAMSGESGFYQSTTAIQMRKALAEYDARQQRAEPHDDEGAAVDTWRCDDGEFITKRGPFGSMQVACVDSPEDARRIVACVNACAGMTTAEIESFDSPGELGRCAMLWAQEDDE